MTDQEARRRLFVTEADSHGGHKLGLCNPETRLLDDQGLQLEDQPPLGAFQRYLWGERTGDINKIIDLAAGGEMIYAHVGDITQGMKYMQQLMSDREADQYQIAEANLAPIVSLPNVRVVRLFSGTASHVFFQATSEIMVAKLLRATYPKKDIRPIAHGLINIDDVLFDISHHGPGAGIRQWTRGNVARHYLKSKMWQDMKTGRRPANVYLRGHYHTFVHETVRERYNGSYYESHLIVLPSWCGMTEYGRQATQSEYEVTNGMVAFEIADGRVAVHPFVRTLDIRTEETL